MRWTIDLLVAVLSAPAAVALVTAAAALGGTWLKAHSDHKLAVARIELESQHALNLLEAERAARQADEDRVIARAAAQARREREEALANELREIVDAVVDAVEGHSDKNAWISRTRARLAPLRKWAERHRHRHDPLAESAIGYCEVVQELVSYYSATANGWGNKTRESTDKYLAKIESARKELESHLQDLEDPQ